MLIVTGWYVALGIAAIFALLALPNEPPLGSEDCVQFGCSLGGRDTALLMLTFAAGWVLAGLAVSFVVSAVMVVVMVALRVRRPFLIGTTAALCPPVVAAVIVAIAMLNR
jgi:hypothetical protein